MCLLDAAHADDDATYAEELGKAIAASCPGNVTWQRDKAARQEAAPAVPAGTDADLKARLLRMVAEEQAALKAAIAGGFTDPIAMNRVEVVKRTNLAALHDIIAVGVPTPERVGRAGMAAFRELVQHAVSDVVLQEQVLKAFEAVDSGIAPDAIATLTDQVRLAQGRPQLYGTSFKISPYALEPEPIEDEAHVEERRRAVGLPPMADYACVLRVAYRVAPRK